MKSPRAGSSHIHSLGFDAETGTMTVRFHRGGEYHYENVEQETFDTLHNHESPGRYFRENVLGQYKHRKA